jgi:hypothetical protein
MRLFIGLAVVFFVAALCAASLLPADLPLGHWIYTLNADLMDRLPGLCQRYLPSFVWFWILLPVLLRPVWMLPAAFGIIAAGLATTLSSRTEPARPRL